MKNLESLKTRSQESLAHLVDLGKQQPEQVQHWGVTAAAALAGALALTAVGKGVLAIVSTVANPPVALTVGALGGGFFGWSFMQGRTSLPTREAPAAWVEGEMVAEIPASNGLAAATAESA